MFYFFYCRDTLQLNVDSTFSVIRSMNVKAVHHSTCQSKAPFNQVKNANWNVVVGDRSVFKLGATYKLFLLVILKLATWRWLSIFCSAWLMTKNYVLLHSLGLLLFYTIPLADDNSGRGKERKQCLAIKAFRSCVS